jgi:hypothetical protein
MRTHATYKRIRTTLAALTLAALTLAALRSEGDNFGIVCSNKKSWTRDRLVTHTIKGPEGELPGLTFPAAPIAPTAVSGGWETGRGASTPRT